MNVNTKNVQISNEETRKRFGTIYRVGGNLLVCKTTSRTVPHNFVNSCRGNIAKFTSGTAGRMRRYLRTCCAEYVNMVTLTYPGFFSTDGRETKEHLRRFLQELGRRVDRETDRITSYSTFWFLEFQDRGAPHYHLFTTHDFPHQFIAATWYRIVNSEDPRHLAAGTRIEKLKAGRSGTISYAQKYAQKQQQKEVPDNFENVGRFWGVSGHRGTVSADTFVSRDDRRSEGVRNSENSLGKAINLLIAEGAASIYLKEKGVAVYVLLSAEAQRRILLKVSILAAKTQKVPQLFQDAEIDINGELYGNY